MTGSPPNLHTMVPIRVRIQDVLKVNVKRKAHVIRTLLWCHEMFAIQYLLTFCLYMHSLYEAPLHSPSSISVRQLHVLSTSFMEWATPSLTVWFVYLSVCRSRARVTLLLPLLACAAGDHTRASTVAAVRAAGHRRQSTGRRHQKGDLQCIFARDSIICYCAHMLSQFRPSVRPSVCHTGDSCRNGCS